MKIRIRTWKSDIVHSKYLKSWRRFLSLSRFFLRNETEEGAWKSIGDNK